ncbi:MAG: type II toxin-antitoxin system RelE/ParE family toxin [Oscillospiraceae bacterium]|nr:type II toxin-antitoxin system RelE/ParE family toxin [Oscillospiraceae bacterium]
MIYKIRIMKPAQTEIRETYRYIAEELKNPVAASRRISLIDKAVESLKENPTRYPLVRDDYLASKGYRMIVVENHLVFFIVREKIKSVSVMRVLYGRRDWMHLLT